MLLVLNVDLCGGTWWHISCFEAFGYRQQHKDCWRWKILIFHRCFVVKQVNIPCCFPFNIGLLVYHLYDLCFIHSSGWLMYRFTCHFGGGKFFGLLIDLFTMHTIMSGQVHRRWKPTEDYKQCAIMCNHTLKSWRLNKLCVVNNLITNTQCTTCITW